MNWRHNSFFQSQVTSGKNVITIINVHWCAVICTSFNISMDLCSVFMYLRSVIIQKTLHVQFYVTMMFTHFGWQKQEQIQKILIEGGEKICGRMQTMHLLNLNETRGLVFVFHLKYKKKIGAVASSHLKSTPVQKVTTYTVTAVSSL